MSADVIAGVAPGDAKNRMKNKLQRYTPFGGYFNPINSLSDLNQNEYPIKLNTPDCMIVHIDLDSSFITQ